MAAYMLGGEYVVGPPLTPARQEWLRHVLHEYGVSVAGATQFVAMQPMTDQRDRQQLLDVFNRAVGPESHRPPGFRGKGR